MESALSSVAHVALPILDPGRAPTAPPPRMWNPRAGARTVVCGRVGRRRLARLRVRGRFAPGTEGSSAHGCPCRGPRRHRGLATAPGVCKCDRSPGTPRRWRRRLDRIANRFGPSDSRCMAKGTHAVPRMRGSWRCRRGKRDHRRARPLCADRLGRSAGRPAPLRPTGRADRAPSTSGVGDRHVLDTRTRLRTVIGAELHRCSPTLIDPDSVVAE